MDSAGQPQIQTVFRNRKFRKIAMGGPQPQIRKFAVIFCTSATANDFSLPQTWTANFAVFFFGLINREDL